MDDDGFAASLRGFGPIGSIAIVLILLSGNIVLPDLIVLPIGMLLVFAWAWRSRTALRELGYVRPALSTFILGLLFGAALKLIMKMLVMPLLGADPINHAYHFLAGNRALLPRAVLAMIVVGFSEETVFRGYMFERIGKLLGSGVGASVFSVLLTSAWFGLAHYTSQGVAGVEQATIVGLVFGAIFSATRRIWLVIWAHTAFDITALFIIYWDLETRIAQLVFN